jgi:uncharacterized protein (TIGR03067 family)
MKILSVVAVVFVPFFPAHAEKPKSDDVKALQGTWRGYVVDGKGTAPDEGPVHLEIVVKGDTIVSRKLVDEGDSPLGEGSFKLAVSGETKTIDATRTNTPGKGQKFLGIYTIAGDTLKWCSATPNKERPKDLETKRGQYLLILKRQ